MAAISFRAVAAIVVSTMVFSLPAIAEISGRVTHITDGDTFHLESVTIRLWGINAPERDTPFGPGATRFLRDAINGKNVRCDERGRDHYGRVVARCWFGSFDVGSLMVSGGWARDWRQYSGGHYFPEEVDAKRDRKGMWR